ncbi:hypothetical protein V2J09_022757 [Rumex salicifolius]
MAVVIQTEIWEPYPSIFVFLVISSFLSIFLLPHFTSRSIPLFDLTISSSFLRFQRKFLLVYTLSSLLQGFWSVFGEYELASHGVVKDQMALSLSAECLAALFIAPFLGMLSDVIGQKKICILFTILHLVVGIWKRVTTQPTIWVTSICLSLSNSIFLFSFETWMVIEHEKLGHRQDILNDTFWLMIFYECASSIGSQILANWLIGHGSKMTIVSPSTAAIFMALITIFFIARCWADFPARILLSEYRRSFVACIFGDKRILLLGCSQACLHFSITVFWILWAPTIVADGREVHLGLIYPILMGARQLGSTFFPWFISGISCIRVEEYLVCGFVVAGCVLSAVAYDYQEMGVLVTLFCLFLLCVGLILPSLAKLRTKYVPNEFRSGMVSLSLAPANVAVLIVLVQGGYSTRHMCNSTIIALASLALFAAAGCIYMLKQPGKQPHQSWHKQ